MRIFQRAIAVAALVTLVMLALAKASFAETRVALVIGNGAYQNAPRLPNPRNDAIDVAAALKRDGFVTIVETDLDKTAMDNATIRFARAARTADVAMFYYSGHAMQFAGVNYLAPIDAKLRDEADLRRLVRLDDIVSDLLQAKNLRILVLDSCRDNPMAEELKRSIGTTRAMSLQRGLARIDSPQGMIVAYSTQAGRTAEDGSGRNSPYTAAFLKNIEAQEEIGTIFRQISEDVYETTKHTQLPELSLSLIGKFYLRGKAEAEIRPGNQTPVLDIRRSDFGAAERVDTIAGWDAFLKQHPDGFYASLAQERRAKLTAKISTLGGNTSQQAALAPTAVPTGQDKPKPAAAPSATADTRDKYRSWTLSPFGSSDRVNALAIPGNDKSFISGGDQYGVQVRDAASGILLRSFSEIWGPVQAVAISRDGRHIVSGSNDKIVRIWNALDGTLDRSLFDNPGPIYSVAIWPDGGRIALSSSDNQIRIRNRANGVPLYTLRGHASLVHALAISPDGTRIVSGSGDTTVKIWDAAGGTLLRTLQGHSKSVYAVAISQDGSRIASGSWDRTLKIWDAANGNLLRTLEGHLGPINALAFSPDGSRIASGGYSDNIRVWDVATGNPLRTLPGHLGPVSALAFSLGGDRIVSGSADGGIRIWDATLGALLQSIFTFGPSATVVIRADGSFWADSRGLDQLRLVRGKEEMVVPEDYKASFLRERPFGTESSAAK
jgi:hypothetical protein